MKSQNPLWNRRFEHLEKIARRGACAALKNARDVAPPSARAQQVV
jgi:hypothetical protein